MYALMGVSPMEAAARIKKQLIDTIGTIAARGHAQLLLARLSALAPIAAQRGNTTNSYQQIISLNALARAHYRRSIGTRASSAGATKTAEVSANAVAVADKFVIVINVGFLCYTIVNLVPVYFPPPPPAPRTKSRQAYHHEAGPAPAGQPGEGALPS
ncbi:hypothetical protein T492DRAFT_863665 [Pavlovales sp. CCMP2436]|nr:hypothetical protein T492DRAFT_863665 [Pavlovales sp. CCMP2436]